MKFSNINPTFKEDRDSVLLRQTYMSLLNRAYKFDESVGIMDLGEDQKISLQDIYVPVDFERSSPKNESIRLHLLDILEHDRHIVVSGLPGSGKTTLSRSIISNLSSELTTKYSATVGRRIPLYFKLRDYDFSKINSPRQFMKIFSENVSSILKRDFDAEFFIHYLRMGWCFLIFDGIDEVGNLKNRQKLRNFIIRYFSRFPDNYILLTSRPVGLEGLTFEASREEFYEPEIETNPELSLFDELQIFGKDHLSFHSEFDENNFEKSIALKFESQRNFFNLVENNFTTYSICSFDESQIETYTNNWFKLRELGKNVEEKSTDFINSIERIESLSELKTRPVFLAMMIHIHTTKGKLPHSRTMAYRYMVEAYIEHIDIARRLKFSNYKEWSFEDKEKMLEIIAYNLQSSSTSGIHKGNSQITIKKKELLELIKHTIVSEEDTWQTINPGDENELLEFYLSRTGLLHEPEEETVQFSHLSFQEYLAARYIYHKIVSAPFKIEETLQKYIIGKLNPDEWNVWREVTILFFSIYKSATLQIIETFAKAEANNYYFHNLQVTLLESIEYGVDKARVKDVVGNILMYFLRYSESTQAEFEIKSGARGKLDAYNLLEALYKNPRIESEVISRAVGKLIKEHRLESIADAERLIYLLTSREYIANKHLSNAVITDVLTVLDGRWNSILELISAKNHSKTKNSILSIPLLYMMDTYETVSYSSRRAFMSTEAYGWKQSFMHLHWKLLSNYAALLFNDIETDKATRYITNDFYEYLTQKMKNTQSRWSKYWYPDIWFANPYAKAAALNNYSLFGRENYIIAGHSGLQPWPILNSNNNWYKKYLQIVEKLPSKGTKRSKVIASLFFILLSENQRQQQMGALPIDARFNPADLQRLIADPKNLYMILSNTDNTSAKDERELEYLQLQLDRDLVFSLFLKRIVKRNSPAKKYTNQNLIDGLNKVLF